MKLVLKQWCWLQDDILDSHWHLQDFSSNKIVFFLLSNSSQLTKITLLITHFIVHWHRHIACQVWNWFNRVPNKCCFYAQHSPKITLFRTQTSMLTFVRELILLTLSLFFVLRNELFHAWFLRDVCWLGFGEKPWKTEQRVARRKTKLLHDAILVSWNQFWSEKTSHADLLLHQIASRW
jgi:hypothetical protein